MDPQKPQSASSTPHMFGFTSNPASNIGNPNTTTPQSQSSNPFISTPPEKKSNKRLSKKMLVLVVTTILVGVAVPATVFMVKNRQDIRSRAAEEEIAITPPPYPTFAPTTPPLSGCSQSCSSHSDCVTGFFCDSGICKNALCPTSIDCQCVTN